jgi:DNA processing protein
MTCGERDAMLTLFLTPGIRHGLVRRFVGAFGSAEGTLGASVSQLAALERVGHEKARRLRRAIDATQESDALVREHEAMARWGVRLIGLGEDGYPKLLEHIGDPPMMLWVRGKMKEDDALALAIVGSRKCTHYGREQAERFAALAAEAGLCIVSGGAYGVDTAAHRGALRGGGRTIAVLGSGLAEAYPQANGRLFDEIVEGRGAVVSELPMGTPPIAENFPRRNRIISGLALGVLLIEAALRSGALITARLCVEEHGRELMALPGRVDSQSSQGCHKAIREGWATLVTNVADVLDALGETGTILRRGMQMPLPGMEEEAGEGEEGAVAAGVLNEAQRAIVAALKEPRSLDELTAVTELGAGQVRAELTVLEIRGVVKRENGLFSRRKAGG